MIEIKYRRCDGCIGYKEGMCHKYPRALRVEPDHWCMQGIWYDVNEEGQHYVALHGEPKEPVEAPKKTDDIDETLDRLLQELQLKTQE